MRTKSSETFLYKGVEYTISELASISHLHRDTILNRLNKGVSIEEALEMPPGQLPHHNREDIGKSIPIVFSQPLPSVRGTMQPVLGKQYIATIHGRHSGSNNLCKVFYIVQLENGKPLITYPGEFRIVREETAS